MKKFWDWHWRYRNRTTDDTCKRQTAARRTLSSFTNMKYTKTAFSFCHYCTNGAKHVNVKFCFNLGKTVIETFKMLKFFYRIQSQEMSRIRSETKTGHQSAEWMSPRQRRLQKCHMSK